jgi:cytoskeletal protein CcmA (bactofilin family)
MFKSKVNVSKTDTLLGEHTVTEGTIRSQASMRIEGKIIGEIRCDGDLTIGEKAVIEANIHARNVIIAGKVEGDVIASGKLAITSTGKLFGNVSSASLSIEEGAVFSGTSMMSAAAGEQARKRQELPEAQGQ